MQVINLSLNSLREAPWNPNKADEATMARLRRSVKRFGLVGNLVVRPLGDGDYEVLSGNQRLQILREAGAITAPCVIADLNDAEARLLAQALNHIHGDDDLGLRAELISKVLERLPQEEVTALLPETAHSLQALGSMGQQDLTERLEAWQRAQSARLKHLTFQLTSVQLELVEEVLARVMPAATAESRGAPNRRGICLYILCRNYLELERRLQ